jgi:hypothetical protein
MRQSYVFYFKNTAIFTKRYYIYRNIHFLFVKNDKENNYFKVIY